VSPSKLSRVIQSLEQELGTRLFDRNNRTVLLTPHGELLLKNAREILQQWETLQDRLQSESSELQGSISLYCSVTASYSFLYDILTKFREQHPQVALKIHTGDPADAVQRVINGEEDIAIAAKSEKMPAELSFKRFAESPLVFIQAATPNLQDWQSTPNNEDNWQNAPLIVSERGVARDRINQWFKDKTLKPNIYAQVAGNEAIVSMVSLGFGLGLVPKIVIDNSPLRHKVEALPKQPFQAHLEVGVCVQSKRLKSPLVRAFWGLIK
ncbi:MAG: LysR family positive regulator for ilvC, partial [Flavobacteriales bacterium]